ncbi:sporulation protein [Pradoshia eiseniae]|uniref:Sporulation protein n=1 Tax=Pradoshia eiseniae TaxID=2064768 RepID=A0A2S7MY00_9BACI|nr:sporulation membrane protein YtrI [Pradoshia eiseniae]PQD94646.1 sporulation protein [Pradoshia eiseniae]
MRIPPYYRNPMWQRFFAGIAIGAVMSWALFFYMFGDLQEKQVQLIQTQQDTIKDLSEEVDIWQSEYEILNKRNESRLLVQDVSVRITNYKKYRLDPLSVFEVEQSIQKDFSSLIGKDLENVSKGKELLKRAIINKDIKVNSRHYQLEIRELVIYTNIEIELAIRQM